MKLLKVIPLSRTRRRREFIGKIRDGNDIYLVFAKYVDIIFTSTKWEKIGKKDDVYFRFPIYFPNRRTIPKELRGTGAFIDLNNREMEELKEVWKANEVDSDNVMFAVMRVEAVADPKSTKKSRYIFYFRTLDFEEEVTYIREGNEKELSERWSDDMLRAVKIYRIAVQPYYPNPTVREFKNFFLDLGLSLEDTEYIYRHRREVGL